MYMYYASSVWSNEPIVSFPSKHQHQNNKVDSGLKHKLHGFINVSGPLKLGEGSTSFHLIKSD